MWVIKIVYAEALCLSVEAQLSFVLCASGKDILTNVYVFVGSRDKSMPRSLRKYLHDCMQLHRYSEARHLAGATMPVPQCAWEEASCGDSILIISIKNYLDLWRSRIRAQFFGLIQ